MKLPRRIVLVGTLLTLLGATSGATAFASGTRDDIPRMFRPHAIFSVIPDPANYSDFGKWGAIEKGMIAIGAPETQIPPHQTKSGRGKVFIYRKSRTVASAIIRHSPALADGSGFGMSVAVDGSYVVVGAPYASRKVNGQSVQTGMTYVFSCGGAQPNCNSAAAPLATIPGTTAHAECGYAVAIGGSSSRLAVAVGCRGGNAVEWRAYLPTAGSWTPVTPLKTLTPPPVTPPTLSCTDFGYSVAMSGWSLAIGCQAADRAYVYTDVLPGSPTLATTCSNPSSTFGYFGDAVAISGSTLLIGAWQSVPQRAYVVKWTGSPSCSTLHALKPSSGAPAFFGNGVAISTAGTLWVSAAGSNSTGAAYEYKMTGGSWPSLPTSKVGTPGIGNDEIFASDTTSQVLVTGYNDHADLIP